MSKDIQSIRESQFVLMYGPGSIIESKNGSRLIPQIKHCLGHQRFKKGFLNKNELLDDVRMSNIIKDLEDDKFIEDKNDINIHLFSLPSNAAQGLSDFEGSYYTFMFPAWKICNNKEAHDGKGFILYDASKSKNKCPVCKSPSSSNVRFVLACPDGHLDDVQWDYAVHGYSSCKPKYYIWQPKGGNLSDIYIKCPDCSSKTNMEEVYKKYFKCSYRTPETELPIFVQNENVFFSKAKRDYDKCGNSMKVVQRQSTSLRIANTITLLKIKKYNDEIVDHIKEYRKSKNRVLKSDSPDRFLEDVEIEEDFAALKIFKEYIDEKGFDNFKRLFKEVFADLKTALEVEFYTLRRGKIDEENFKKKDFIKKDLKWLNKSFPIKICSVDELTTITAQLNYQRKPYFKKDEHGAIMENKPVSSGFKDGKDIWYPAYEGVGEGIFITSDENPIDYLGLNEISNIWDQRIKNIDVGSREEIKDPLFVWWHTLSHALINSLSLSCGYNSTSLKERVYIKDGLGGILIYNTSPGEDSGMGGLVETVKSFDIVLNNAMDSLISCSNDPLCLNQTINDGGVNGAACHNCLLVSETSCEHRNALLDRHFFID